MATQYNKDAVKQSADKLANILADTSAFEALAGSCPDAGVFDLAKWLEQVVNDRAAAIVAHAARMQVALKDLGSFLSNLVTSFDSLDGSNADQIKNAVSDLEKSVGTDMGGLTFTPAGLPAAPFAMVPLPGAGPPPGPAPAPPPDP
ncbi:hypothetical protein ABT266_21290, partial [Amycolatopsis sp. NPDC000746]